MLFGSAIILGGHVSQLIGIVFPSSGFCFWDPAAAPLPFCGLLLFNIQQINPVNLSVVSVSVIAFLKSRSLPLARGEK